MRTCAIEGADVVIVLGMIVVNRIIVRMKGREVEGVEESGGGRRGARGATSRRGLTGVVAAASQRRLRRALGRDRRVASALGFAMDINEQDFIPIF
jgi:hypothetical protein